MDRLSDTAMQTMMVIIVVSHILCNDLVMAFMIVAMSLVAVSAIDSKSNKRL